MRVSCSVLMVLGSEVIDLEREGISTVENLLSLAAQVQIPQFVVCLSSNTGAQILCSSVPAL